MYITDSAIPIEILIVEDDSLYRKTIVDFLQEDSGFKIIGEAKDGQTAVNLAKELKPDVVLMDLGLPVMPGIEATIKIKESNPSVKIIVLSANINLDEAIESLAAGATAYVNKDIHMDQMKMIIETINKGAIWLSPFIGQKILTEAIKCCQK